jgi:hypothetical protein
VPLTIRVRPGADLQEVMYAAKPGTRIILSPGTYNETVVVTKPLEITGDGSGGTVSLGARDGSCLRVESEQTIIWGLHLGTASTSETLLDIQADNVAVDECVVSGGETTVRVGGANVTMDHCDILNGRTGLHLDQCKQVDIVDCTIRNHQNSGVVCTNLGTDTRLVACDISNNEGFGLSTSYFSHYQTLYGPKLYQCSIHHNGIHGVSITDEAWYTTVLNCRIFENTQAQVYLAAETHVDICDIAGGQIGIAVTGGQAGIIASCKIHDVPVGIWVGAPLEEGGYTFIHSSWIYNTTKAATRTTNQGSMHFLCCVVRDNTGIGIDVGTGTTQEVRECRIARNAIGVLVRPEGIGEVSESIVAQNSTGVHAQSGSKVGVSYCHVDQHTGPAIVLEKDTKGNVADCTFRSNAAGNIERDARSQVYEIGDPQVDHLARRDVNIPPE